MKILCVLLMRQRKKYFCYRFCRLAAVNWLIKLIFVLLFQAKMLRSKSVIHYWVTLFVPKSKKNWAITSTDRALFWTVMV